MTGSVIYLITNKINNKKYVGCSYIGDYENRWKCHIEGKSECLAICSAIQMYGKDNFNFEVILQLNEQTKQIFQIEKEYIKQYDSFGPNGYNLTEGGEGVPGHKHSDKTKELMRQMKIGICEKGTSSYNKRYTPEVREKLSKSQSERMKNGYNPKASKWKVQKDTGEIFEVENPTDYFRGGLKSLWNSNKINKPISKGQYKGWKLLEIIKI